VGREGAAPAQQGSAEEALKVALPTFSRIVQCHWFVWKTKGRIAKSREGKAYHHVTVPILISRHKHEDAN